MVAKSVKWVLAGLMLSPTAALALGLGDIHLLSTLNAPLDADIDLIGASPDELASLTPKIASREVFAQHGLDWPAFLSNVTVRAVHTANGRDVLELRSTEPVTEPFLTVLVELDWDRGHFVREYTMLLDPPLYTPSAGRVAHQAIEGATSGATAHEGTVQRPALRAGANAAGAASAANAAAGTGGSPASAGAVSGTAAAHPDTYLVRRGDTLSAIAAKLGSGGGVEEKRWMVAAFQANPDAFDHNINLLRSGAVLRVPSESAVEAVSADQANVEVHRQYVAWRGTSHTAAEGEQPGRLRLVAPGQAAAAGAGGAGAAGASAGAGVKALQGEVQSLQSQLAESRRLLDMRNAQLAQLQAKLAARESGGAEASAPAASAAAASPAGPNTAAAESAATSAAAGAAATAATTPEAAAPTGAEAASASNAQPPAATSPAAAASASSTPRAAHKPPRRPAASPHAASGGSWLDALGPIGWGLAALVAALLALLGFRAWNSRRNAGFDDSLGRLAEAGATATGVAPVASALEPAFPETAPQMAPRQESSFLVEESGTHERPRFESPDAAAPAARHVEADDTISSETAINLDQGDPLAEADFHMAYGLYDQAADLVRIAIQREPERRDLKLKLLEVFFVWGNKEQFLATARELADTRAEAAPGEWEKIVIMGKQLAPDDPLFAGGAAVSGAAAGGVDLDLEGGATGSGKEGVDFDILGEPLAGAGGEGVDLDIGTAIGERDPAAEAAAQRATDRNLALDESLVLPEDSTVEREAATATQQMLNADAATGSTREMTARAHELAGNTREMTATLDRVPLEHEVTWDPEQGTPEAPTVEQPALSTPENPTIRQKVEMALRAGAGEHTAELALDDLGLDLTALAPGPEAPEAGAAESLGEPSEQSDAPTLVAGLDEHSRQLMESAEQRALGGDGELKVSETGTWHFDADPLAGGPGRHDVQGGDPSATSRLAALNGGSLDFEVGEPEREVAARANGAGGVDLDVGTATVPDVAFTATTRLSTDDLALPDLDPATMSEVGTKLDLARAYMDMGDPEGARNILEEVLTEGSAVQKQEAERLIASLPG